MRKPENIEALISRFLSGEASPEEAMLLEDWKQESESNRQYYAECERVFFLAAGEKPFPGPEVQPAWKKVRANLQPVSLKPVRRRNFYLAAASVLLLAAAGTVLFYTSRRAANQEAYISTDNQAQRVTLSDGSEVNIMPHSRVTTGQGFGTSHRRLHLEGSAYFSVTHSENLPLTIDAGKVFIQDIGTRFLIRSPSVSDTVYVQVDEGTVLLFDTLGSSLEMQAPETALYLRSAHRIITDRPAPPAALHFSGTRLSEVVEQLNNIYHTHIVLENNRLGDCTITTRFSQEDLETILLVITETLGLRYEKTDGGYIIRGQACGS